MYVSSLEWVGFGLGIGLGKKKEKHSRRKEKKKRALERKATSRRSLSLSLTKVNPGLKVVDFSIKISFHLVCCLKRAGLCSFDRFGKSLEIRV